MRRKIVLREVSTPKRLPNRTPPLPQVARPIEVICSRSLVVIGAHGSARSGSRSVNTFREQYGLGKRTCGPSEKAEVGVRHKERLSRFDGSGYGCETKAVNRADNKTGDELRSRRPPVQPLLSGSGQFLCLLRE